MGDDAVAEVMLGYKTVMRHFLEQEYVYVQACECDISKVPGEVVTCPYCSTKFDRSVRLIPVLRDRPEEDGRPVAWDPYDSPFEAVGLTFTLKAYNLGDESLEKLGSVDVLVGGQYGVSTEKSHFMPIDDVDEHARQVASLSNRIRSLVEPLGIWDASKFGRYLWLA